MLIHVFELEFSLNRPLGNNLERVFSLNSHKLFNRPGVAKLDDIQLFPFLFNFLVLSIFIDSVEFFLHIYPRKYLHPQ